jgi:protein O-GlcNAc transferase
MSKRKKFLINVLVMDYKKFLERLPNLYENWGKEIVYPKSDRFHKVLTQVKGMTTANIMQLLNCAVEYLEPNEVYCEIGCFQGASLIGALLDRPACIAYAVDNFSEFDTFADSFDNLTENLSKFDLEDRVIFCNQNFEEFFCEWREAESEDQIGLYFYDGACDYRSNLMGLLLVKSSLSHKSLIIIGNSNWEAVRQSSWDFVATHPQCKLLLDLTSHEKYSDATFGNGLQIFSWDSEQNNNYNWSTFQQVRNELVIQNIYNLQAEEKQKIINNLHKTALELHHSSGILLSNQNNYEGKKYDEDTLQIGRQSQTEAEEKYREVLRWDNTNADAWRNLGMVYYMAERYQDALNMLLKSFELDSSRAIQHYNLGLVFEKIGDTARAIQAYQESIALDSKWIDPYNNLGNIFSELGDFTTGESVYRQAITANPEHFGSYLNLGNVLMAQQQIDDAIDAYETALKLKPRTPDILNNLGIAFEAKNDRTQAALYFGYAFNRQGKYEEAVNQFQKFRETQEVGDASFYRVLAESYESLNQYEEALNVYQEGVSLYPNDSALYFCWILALQNAGRTQEAIALASKASQLMPDDISLKREEKLILPVLYENQEEIDYYRHRFVQGLEDLILQTSLDTPEARKNALLGVGKSTNFYLQYQGCNDLELQKKYGQLIHQIMVANYPQWADPLPVPPLSSGAKIRVGYVSNCLRAHTVGKLSLGWLRNSNHKQFEVYCYHINRQQDIRTQKFRLYSDVFHQIPDDLEAVCTQIISDRLHVLVFLDIGMQPQMTQIAGLRLAPIQCTTWGHPITSGLPTIDYFLSSALMEPENAQKHYSEQLVCLPNIGISYAKPIIPGLTKKRSYFQLRDDAVVYLSCQSLYKYLPQYDCIFAEIARQVPQAQFVFLSNPSLHITEKFQQRLQRAFAKYGLKSENYCVILERLDQISYWHLNLVSDIFLDTFNWSGGNTALEAIACNLPIVTCPGELMRGRHSYGVLKMLGVTDTIAIDEAEYIEIAVKLGLDPEWRNSIVNQMIDRHSYVYDDKTCVEALEAFYQRVVQEKQLATTPRSSIC